jgi:Sigma-70, region 4
MKIEPKPIVRLPILDHIQRSGRTNTIDPKKISEDEWEALSKEFPESEEFWKPTTRADCTEVARPCRHISCINNTFLDVSDSGRIRFNYPGLEPGDERIQYSCVSDLAEDFPDGIQLDDVGAILNISRERARQLETGALAKLARNGFTAKKVRELLGE